MPVTLVGAAGSEVGRVSPALVEIKPTWGASWGLATDLVLQSASLNAGSREPGQATILKRYGAVKTPFDGGVGTYAPDDLARWWVRVVIDGVVVWVGRVLGETRTIYGSAPTPGGRQLFTAYDGVKLLDQIAVDTMLWLEDGVERRLGWRLPFNRRDVTLQTVGNRSSSTSGGSFVFGGEELWTFRQAAEYLLFRFADDSANGGPAWGLSGQLDAIDELVDAVDVGPGDTVLTVLRRLLRPEWGLDFAVVPIDDGFVVNVFTLADFDTTFAGVTIPANPASVDLFASQTVSLTSPQYVRSQQKLYDTIVVRGQRIVVATTLRASDATLVPKWSDELETEYQEAPGTVLAGVGFSGELQDAFRTADRFERVYSAFGAPAGWDLAAAGAAPLFDDLGELTPGAVADFQTATRRTLPRTPLREGVDYSTTPPTDRNPAGVEPEFARPRVWILDDRSGTYVPVESQDIAVSVPQLDWGVLLSARPNHRIAKGVFAGLTDYLPEFDYRTLIATVAFETDQAIEMRIALPAGSTPTGGVLEIPVDDAEAWVLAPNTVIGMSPTGQPVTSGTTARVLRNDAPRLALAAAGAISRYYVERARGSVEWRGLYAFADLLGVVLGIIESGATAQPVRGPITSIVWDNGESPRTRLKAGFAR